MMIARMLLRAAAVAWASPYSLLGLAVGLLGLSTGGSVRLRDGVLEFSGGATRWFVTHLPTGPTTLAITLGHVVLGQTEAALDISHTHEIVHVRQFARWGPLMGPAYLTCALVLWLQGRRPYRDNPFERQAYGKMTNDK
jgi:hypothetical protein